MDDIINIDLQDDDDLEPVQGVPEPQPISPPSAPMPSSVSLEAWRNVEEMLITLSNNNRTSLGDIRNDIKELLSEVKSRDARIEDSLSKIGMTMDEFKALLKAATVEDDSSKPSPTPIVQVKKKGYASRRRAKA